MRIAPIGLNGSISPVYKKYTDRSQILPQHIDKSIYSKGMSDISFGGNMISKYMDYIYPKSISKHAFYMSQIIPKNVEEYCQRFGIQCSLKEGRTEMDNKVVAYCVFRGLEIMRQLKLPLPAKILIGDAAKSNSLAECYYYPDIMKNYPIGTVVYNKMQDWANLLKNSVAELNQNTHFHTTCHFMHTTIHEFGHNVHFNKLYSKFGSPVPDPRFQYNPAVKDIMDKLNMKIYDDSGRPMNNPFITPKVRDIMKQSSGYGSSLLPELFAEEFANAIIYNMNFMTLKMVRNPFPIKNVSPELQQVLNETWEGLIGDGQGLI